MPLTVTTANNTPNPAPQIVAPARVVEVARNLGSPGADRALAVTSPRLTIDLRGCNFSLFGTPPNEEFAFNTGTMALTLNQEVFIANDLSPCAQGVWAQHEAIHVRDNAAVLARMPTEIANDPSLQAIFRDKQRFPRGDFALIQDAIQNMVGTIFRRLTGEAVTRLDTRREYSRVNQEIIRSCPGPHFHTVVSGENLSFLSEFYYGTQSHAMTIYRRNQGIIGNNPNLIRPGQRLEIPRV
ncbi:MAG: LysM peptidoglycan-binding domain-containing protein [Bryobacterales bacterium]|nr:LysM peptidoglycan-binding domain-containing protein [Bryobacterales bacterium]